MNSGNADAAARYRAIFESAIDFGIIVTDRDGLVTDWNSGSELIFGWPEDAMLGRPVDCCFTPEDRAADRPGHEMREALERGRAADERWHLRCDGTRFWASGETMPLRDGSGGHLGFLKILRDRTEQRLVAERQRSDSEFLARVLSASGDCIKVLDLDANLLFISESGQRLMEIEDAQTILGCPWPDFWCDDGHVAAQAALDAARAGKIGRFEGTADTLKGNPRWWAVQVTPILGADGRPEKLLVVSRDISDRRKADVEIGNLAALVEQSNDFIGIGSADGRSLFVNPAGRRLIGLTDAASARALDVMAYFMPEDQGTLTEIVLPAVRQHGYWQGELRFRHVLTGVAIPVLYTLFPLRDESGGLTGYGTVTRDLREFHKANARRMALLELSDRMHNLDDPGEMAFVAAEIMGRALDVDRTGYGTVDLRAETFLVDRDWTAPGTCGSVAGVHHMREYGSYIENLNRGETVAVSDVAQDARTSANQSALHDLSVSALVNLPLIEQGRLVALFYLNNATPRTWSNGELDFVRDVAERTRDAIERRRAERRLRELALGLEQQVAERTRERDRIWQVSPDLLGVADLEGRWIGINPAWEAVLGWTEADIVGRTGQWLEHPDDQAANRMQIARLASGDRTIGYEQRYRMRAGGYRWLSWIAVPEDGQIYCVARDVTAERQAADALREAEERLRQSQKMEAVGQLTGGLAHDFNNLLTGIGGSLELLGTRVAQGRMTEIGRYISAAQGATRRAAALTHRLLAFSRRQPLDPRPTGINRLVAGMEDLIRRTVGPSIEIEVVGAIGLWTTLVDPNQLENVLLNLCINARDAMPDGGRITIATANEWMDERRAQGCDLSPGPYSSLSVTDTGTGMPPEVIARAFDPFFTTKPIGQGTGLGLSMIYGFARQSGGQVTIASAAGCGTTMHLYLPRHPGPDDAGEDGPVAAEAPRAEQGETVLVVDDEQTVRMLVRETLEDLGYRAIEAMDSAGGLRLLQSDVRIDLLVTDVGLPGGMNGRQVADAGRAIRPGLKVLFITGYAENAVVGNGVLEPGMHVLTKPFAMEVLASRISELITAG